ncbi:hypothetical protein W97_05800 [Coniosporium apollinis CBS 100218]|uniref:Uncharacterized protein n=1 Tax=Coniosporium apollinis (strain CBS 100218) TaxID=1168221 RepID=R7YXA4_CONA1|nr:uncharacterized protein W97_05800 [Coniosporium apollinis CBS 100218]EON66555.1 hypothetical protein W97_05800 [Coniosporium apollinis CBS 100218]
MREEYAKWQRRRLRQGPTTLEADKQGAEPKTEQPRLSWEAKKTDETQTLVREIEKEAATRPPEIKKEPAEEKQPRRLPSDALRKEKLRSLAVARSVVSRAQRLAGTEIEMKRVKEEAERKKAREEARPFHVQRGPTKSSRRRAREGAEAKAGEERPQAAEVLEEVPKQRYNWAQHRHRWERNKRKPVKAKKVDGKSKPAGMRQQRRLPSLNEGLIRSVRALTIQAKNPSLKSVNWGTGD